jgi:dCTP deaminase
MILSAQTILRCCKDHMLMGAMTKPMITPFYEEKQIVHGMSFGLSAAGYDIRLAQDIELWTEGFVLGSSMERFCMPRDVLGIVHDKSTLARRGLSVFNTVIEPGWEGFLTLELKNQGIERITLPAGCPIAQVVFHFLDRPTMSPYSGKYQNQEAGPREPIHES